MLYATFVPQMSFADVPTLSNEEYRSSICAIVSQGAFIVAVERQKGMDKQMAKQRLDRALADLSKQFHNQIFLQRVAETWYADLERIYQMALVDTPEEKATFAYMLEEMSYSACVGKAPAISF